MGALQGRDRADRRSAGGRRAGAWMCLLGAVVMNVHLVQSDLDSQLGLPSSLSQFQAWTALTFDPSGRGEQARQRSRAWSQGVTTELV